MGRQVAKSVLWSRIKQTIRRGKNCDVINWYGNAAVKRKNGNIYLVIDDESGMSVSYREFMLLNVKPLTTSIELLQESFKSQF